MKASVVQHPRAHLATYREIVAHPESHDVATVRHACLALIEAGDLDDFPRAASLFEEIAGDRRARNAARLQRATVCLVFITVLVWLVVGLLRLF